MGDGESQCGETTPPGEVATADETGNAPSRTKKMKLEKGNKPQQ